MEGGLSCQAPVKVLWNPYFLTKVGFFCWEAWWGKVLTLDQMKKRGSIANVCGKNKHILIHSPLIWDLWAAILSTFGAIGARSFLVRDFMSSWGNFPT